MAPKQGSFPMLYWALVFLVVALIAGILGFGTVASTAASIAQIVFAVAVVVFVLALILGIISATTNQRTRF